MGDISELRGLLTVVTFLGVCVLLIMLIPPQIVVGQEGKQVYVPDYFEAMDVFVFAETNIIGMNETGGDLWFVDNRIYYVTFELGNWDMNFFYMRPNQGALVLWLVHIHYEWIIFPADCYMNWRDSQGLAVGEEGLAVQDLEDNSDNGYNSEFTAYCDHFSCYVSFAYDPDIYSSFSDAWNGSGLHACFGVNFDQINTSFNAFGVLGMLLFFKLPDVHWLINLMLNIPIWCCVAYLTFIFILRTIGAIFGGGGA